MQRVKHFNVKTNSVAIGFGVRLDAGTMVDASAAPGIISRRGLGKVRHFDANHLWIQEVSASKRAKFDQVAGSTDPADRMTEKLPAADIEKHVGTMQARFVEGRPEIVARVAVDAEEAEIQSLSGIATTKAPQATGSMGKIHQDDDEKEASGCVLGAHQRWVGPDPGHPSLPLAGPGGLAGNQEPNWRAPGRK